MRKILSFILAVFMTFSGFSGVCVFADTQTAISLTKAVQLEDKSVYLSGKITNPIENQEITIIAVKLENGAFDQNNSVYIDQQSSIIKSDGTFALTFNPKTALEENSEYVVRVGGTEIVNSATMKIRTSSSGEVEFMLGDVDADGDITVNDASLALQYVLDSSKLDEKILALSDLKKRINVTGESNITAKQVSAILSKALDSSFEFPDNSGEDTTKTEETTKTEGTTKAEDTTKTEDTTKVEDTTQSSSEEAENTTSASGGDDDDTTEATTEVVFDGDILVDNSLLASVPEENKYKTVGEAISAISAPADESQRVVVDIMPGVYREQVVIKKPYITLRKNPNADGEVKITWYYATGSMYDSIATSGDLKGFYDPNAIGDGELGIPTHWGAAMNVEKGANGIIVKDITFENSYNQYYTQEELNDGLTFDPDTNNSDFDRGSWIKEQIANGKTDEYINNWIQSRTNMTYKGVTGSLRERACAFYCSADKFEAYNCKFISKQDTMGINSGREYYENCLLAGTVDYICGSATAVFNNCELKFDAGPDMHTDELSSDTKAASDSGHVTAPANKASDKGYLFYKCRITGSDNAVAGTLGRPWGNPGGPEAIYYKTTIENNKSGQCLIVPAGWADMSGTKKDEARFYEFGSVDANGNAIDVSKRVLNSVAPMGTVIDKWQVLEFNPYNYTKGTDGWDPMNMAGKYAEFEEVVKNITFDSNVTGDITLPTPASGYEYYWESDTDYAIIDSAQKSIAVTRPAYGNDPIEANLTVYVLKSGTEYGVKDNVKLTILPNDTTDGTFSVGGKVSLGSAAEKDVEILVQAIQNGAVVAKQTVTVLAGETEKEYTINYLPAGEYTVRAQAVTNGYRVTEPTDGETKVSGVSGEIKGLNVSAKALEEVTLKTEDFAESWAVPTATVSDSSVTATVVEGTSDLTANIGVGNKVLKFTKEEGKTVTNKVGFYLDLAAAVKASGGTITNSDTLQFAYDLLLEKDKNADGDGNGYMASEYSFIDFTTKLTDGASAANQGRYARYGIHKGWNQLNFFTAANSRVNGDNTQFDKNSTMRNKWYHIVTDVDLKAQKITVSVYDKETGSIINKKAYNIAVPAVDGTNTEYPTELVSDALYMAVYMDNRGTTSNKIEFYVDNVELKYQDFK